jgi:hypothetical protein
MNSSNTSRGVPPVGVRGTFHQNRVILYDKTARVESTPGEDIFGEIAGAQLQQVQLEI